MLQVSQNLQTGDVLVLDVPPPALRTGGVLVRTAASLISSGTERTKVQLGRKSLLAKTKERPEAVRQVMDVIRREGVAAAYRRVQHRLKQLTPLGYSAAGVVVEVGAGVTRLRKGDRVAVGGGGYANHAEILWVPENLAVRIPEGVSFDAACFATIAAIALHGLRLGRPGLNDTVAVVGLGLVGQLAVRLAGAAGCKVAACDPEAIRVRRAEQAGAVAVRPEQLTEAVRGLSHGVGADLVLVTAGTGSSGPLRLAAQVSRDRASVVAVGAVGMEVPREQFYRKELELLVSRSYGPGRYDPSYEEKGTDYPVGYVRWTEGRNLGAILDLMGARRLDVTDLISHRFPIERAAGAYELLVRNDPNVIGVVLDYPAMAEAACDATVARPVPHATPRQAQAPLALGFIGIGSFASNVLIPALKATRRVRLQAVVSASGLSARDAVRRHGFGRALAGPDELMAAPDVDAVFIATPHHLHADLVRAALAAGKAVFVEKPLAIDWDQHRRLVTELPRGAPVLVGFNRRFSPHVAALAPVTASRKGAAIVSIRVNAGPIPPESWIHDPQVGGGRLVGEACHFVDLCAAIVGEPPTAVRASGVAAPDPDAHLMDNFVIILEFGDGSLGTILYTSRGDPNFGKERVEVFVGGSSGLIENFDRSTVLRNGRCFTQRARAAKGHREEVAAFVDCVLRGGPMPVDVDTLLASTAATLAARDSLLASGQRIAVS